MQSFPLSQWLGLRRETLLQAEQKTSIAWWRFERDAYARDSDASPGGWEEVGWEVMLSLCPTEMQQHMALTLLLDKARLASFALLPILTCFNEGRNRGFSLTIKKVVIWKQAGRSDRAHLNRLLVTFRDWQFGW